MAIGKYLSLREAINEGLLKRFAKEHKTTGDKDQFESVLASMTRTPATNGQAPESGLSHWLVALTVLNQPIQIGFTPAVTGQAVERKGVVVTVKLFHCPHADHGKSIAISIQDVCPNLALDFYFFGGLTRAVIVYVRFYQERPLKMLEKRRSDMSLTAKSGQLIDPR